VQQVLKVLKVTLHQDHKGLKGLKVQKETKEHKGLRGILDLRELLVQIMIFGLREIVLMSVQLQLLEFLFGLKILVILVPLSVII
jgi:hypothetical protein